MIAHDTAPLGPSGYQIVPGLLDPSWAAFFCHYARTLTRAGLLESDPQVEGAGSRYGDPLFDTLLEALVPAVGQHLGIAVLPTYSFLRIYYSGQLLRRHTDRESCEFTLTMHLGSDTHAPWPIFVQDRLGSTCSFELTPGDGLIYEGIALPHWRERFAGDWHAQVFLHFVADKHENAHLANDGRTNLGISRASLD